MKENLSLKRLLEIYPYLNERREGLPLQGKRSDGKEYSERIKLVDEAMDFYGYKLYNSKNMSMKEYNIGGGNPMKYKPFPLCIKSMKKSLKRNDLYKYPYTEGADRIRQILINYVEKEGIFNDNPYKLPLVDEKGLCVHNVTFTPSTSYAFKLILDIILKPNDVVLMTGPNYGLFGFKVERMNANVEIIDLKEENNYLIDPKDLESKIDEINNKLKIKYKGENYIPRVVALVNANPNNPTGKVMGKNEEKLLTEIGNVCLEKGVFIIDDLIYRDLTFDKNNIAKPVASIKGMFKNTISLFGLSKAYNLASLRAGFVVADEIIIRELTNRIFQEMDASPSIIGEALIGAFNDSKKRDRVYNKYFKKLNKEYFIRYNLLKAMVDGIDSIKDKKIKEIVKKDIIKYSNKENKNFILKGIPYVSLLKNIEPEAGFFTLLDFTELKGKKTKDLTVNTEKDLLIFLYKNIQLRFIVGRSVCFKENQKLIGRVTFAIERKEIVEIFELLNKLLRKEDLFF